MPESERKKRNLKRIDDRNRRASDESSSTPKKSRLEQQPEQRHQTSTPIRQGKPIIVCFT